MSRNSKIFFFFFFLQDEASFPNKNAWSVKYPPRSTSHMTHHVIPFCPMQSNSPAGGEVSWKTLSSARQWQQERTTRRAAKKGLTSCLLHVYKRNLTKQKHLNTDSIAVFILQFGFLLTFSFLFQTRSQLVYRCCVLRRLYSQIIQVFFHICAAISKAADFETNFCHTGSRKMELLSLFWKGYNWSEIKFFSGSEKRLSSYFSTLRFLFSLLWKASSFQTVSLSSCCKDFGSDFLSLAFFFFFVLQNR